MENKHPKQFIYVVNQWFRLLKESPSKVLGKVVLIGIHKSVT